MMISYIANIETYKEMQEKYKILGPAKQDSFNVSSFGANCLQDLSL